MSPGPVLVRHRRDLPSALAGAHHRRGVVMTMGALHEGHLALVRRAREVADQVVVTIFVNPLQFGPGEDFDAYPRDLDRDLELLAAAGVDLVFAPDPAELYPDGEPVVRVSAGRIGQRLEGAQRAGHFDGVLTVVLKLCHLLGPDVVLFGQKDAQQLMLVRKMVADLDLAVEVLAVETVREPGGLALSSRNEYLSKEELTTARALYQALLAARAAVADGAGGVGARAAAARVLDAAPLAVDYLALVDPTTAEDLAAGHQGSALLAVAARVGTTRLIDNLLLELTGEQDR